MKNDLHLRLDAVLSGVEWTQRDRRAVLTRIQAEEERPMKRKMTTCMAVALVLALLTAGAVASGLIFSPQMDAVRLADAALETQYGITLEMQTYFQRSTTENAGKTQVIYEGMPGLEQLLGTYTVTVDGAKTTAAWSLDGVSTDGGLDADAWGKDQLKEMLRLHASDHTDATLYRKVLERSDAIGGADAPTTIALDEAFWLESQRALAATALIPTPSLELLAREAIQAHYQITDAQAASLTPLPSLCLYTPSGDALWYTVALELASQTGIYFATIDANTGVIVDLQYKCALSGIE